MTSTALANFLRCLDPIPSAAEEKYEQIHHRLVKYFECNWCADPDGATDVTIDRAIRKIDEGTTVPNIYNFLFGIAKFVLKEQRKTASLTVPLPLEVPVAEPEDQAYIEQRVACLSRCLGKLKPEARDLFMSYYGEGSRETLPTSYGATMNALRIRVFNIKGTLERCLMSCVQGNPV